MGSIRRAPRTNRWEARYRDPYGAQRTATFDRKADALAYLASVETDKQRGDWFDPEASSITLAQWHERWWPTIENGSRAANTIVQYEAILRVHVLAHLGRRTMASLPASTWRSGWRPFGRMGWASPGGERPGRSSA